MSENAEKKGFNFKFILIALLPFIAFGIKTFFEYLLKEHITIGIDKFVDKIIYRIVLSSIFSVLILIYLIFIYNKIGKKNR